VIRHVVLFRLAATDPVRREADVAEMRRRLEALVPVVPGVSDLVLRADLGVDDGHWDAVLVSHHATREDLASYAVDPRHREVIAFVSTVVTDRAVVDCDLETAG
jgi:hypothetical protein